MSSCCETLMLGHRLQGTRLTGAHLRGLMIIDDYRHVQRENGDDNMTDATAKAAPKAERRRRVLRSGARSSIVVGGAIVLFFVLLAPLAGPLSAITGNDPYAEHPEADRKSVV